MGTGIDWNGNGKYDSIDVGIDIAFEDVDEENREKKFTENSSNKPVQNAEGMQSGCLSTTIMLCLCFVVSISILL